MSTKNILLMVAVLIIMMTGGYYFLTNGTETNYSKENIAPNTEEANVAENSNSTTTKEAEVTKDIETEEKSVTNIGQSAGKNNIEAYHFGKGDTELLFIGGIHGGYSWNTALLSFEIIDWFKKNEDKIPDNLKVTIIPVLNPDGLKKVTGKTGTFVKSDVDINEALTISGRFNANEVDLNRNFDCEWKAAGTWQNKEVSGGTSAFSEPEAQAVRKYVEQTDPVAVVTWYSAAGGVYSSNCKNGVSKDTLELTKLFAKASGYTAHEEFNYYEITGDMVNWLASKNIPAISVLLTNHEQTEFEKNLAGIEALLNHYAN
jgi:carboxypeptidase T